MNKLFYKSRQAGLLLLMALTLAPNLAQSQENTAMKMGLYVVVDDMTVAKQFYQQLFRAEPSVDNGDFVSFRFGQGIFALYSASAYSHKLNRGNNVVPYFQVANIEAEFSRVGQLSPKLINTQIVDEGAIKLFMFTDPSGNKLEFYSLE